MVEGSVGPVEVGARADKDWVSNLDCDLRRNSTVTHQNM